MECLTAWSRTLSTVSVLFLACIFALSDLRLDLWQSLEVVFEWSETTPFGVIAKTWGAVFAVVEAFHLIGLALLGGAVLVGDGRLLGWWFNDYDCRQVQDGTHKVF